MRRLLGVFAGVVATAALVAAMTAPLPSAPPTSREKTAEELANEAFTPLSAIRYSQDGIIAVEPDYEVRPDPMSSVEALGDAESLTLANMTVAPGQYVVGFTFEYLLRPGAPSTGLSCGVADSNGSAGMLFRSTELLSASNGWQRLTFVTPAGLPDMTLALRCSPVDSFTGIVSFRDVEFAATRAR
jgi:hypothetical protein